MAGKQLTIALLFRMIDQLTGPARRVVGSIEDVDHAAKRAAGLKAMGDAIDGVGKKMQFLGGASLGVGLAVAGGSGLLAVPKLSVEAQHDLLAIANTADLTEDQVGAATIGLRMLSRDVNQYQRDLLMGLGILTAAGLQFDESMGSLPAIGKTATAETAAIADLANASFSAISNLKLPVEQLGPALDMMAAAGHAGQFELRDMARYFPELTSTAGMLGMRGTPAVLSIAAALQIARRGAGDAGTAANNMANFLQKLASPEVQKNFAALGVSIKKEIEGSIASGEDPILHMVQLIDRLTKGDPFKIGTLIGDIQAQNFLKPMLQNIADFEQIKRESAKGGVVDRDFARIMTSAAEQGKLFIINMQKLGGAWFTAPLRTFNALLSGLNAHPLLQTLIGVGAIGLIAFGGLTLGIGSVIRLGGMFVSNIGAMRVGIAAFKEGWIGLSYPIAAGPRLIAGLAATLRGATATVWGFTSALLANPLTWVVVGAVALAGAGYLIYRNWDRVSAVLAGAWSWLKGAGARMYDAGANLVSMLWHGITSVASKPVEAFKAITQRIRNHLPFSPAKEGPLRDIHRIRLVETIAGTIQPAPVLRAMRTVALATSAAASALPAQRVGAGGGSFSITIPYSPQVTIGPGATPDMLPKVQRMLAEHKRELERMVKEIMRDRGRTEFR